MEPWYPYIDSSKVHDLLNDLLEEGKCLDDYFVAPTCWEYHVDGDSIEDVREIVTLEQWYQMFWAREDTLLLPCIA